MFNDLEYIYLEIIIAVKLQLIPLRMIIGLFSNNIHSIVAQKTYLNVYAIEQCHTPFYNS